MEDRGHLRPAVVCDIEEVRVFIRSMAEVQYRAFDFTF